jgi:predicted AAA+ superfamily ATPase
VFCDDLSFDCGRSRLQGAQGDARRHDSRRRRNLLIYATSNRRHLMPGVLQRESRDEAPGR